MSDIQFLKQLGDNLEEAARKEIRQPSPRRGKRRLIVALAVAVTAVTGIAAASMLGGSEELAASSIGCYETSDLGGNVTVLSADGAPPVRVCEQVRSEQGLPPQQLVACVRNETVAVFPGRDCSGAGLEELPGDYGQAVAKVERFGRSISRIEASMDCYPPEELAEKAREVLQRQGWDDWEVVVRPNRDGAPCGQITAPSGDGSRSIVGVLDTVNSKVFVFAGLPRSLEDELYGERGNGVGGAIATVMEASGERCHTPASLMQLARDEFSDLDPNLSSRTQTLPKGTALADARGRRYEEGCAVIGDIVPTVGPSGKPNLEVGILQLSRPGA